MLPPRPGGGDEATPRGRRQHAAKALAKILGRRRADTACDFLFLAMSHWQLGAKDTAREWYGRAVIWKKTRPPADAELERFPAEARGLLGIDSTGGR